MRAGGRGRNVVKILHKRTMEKDWKRIMGKTEKDICF